MYLVLLETCILGYIVYKLATWYLNSKNEYWTKKGIPTALVSDFTSWFNIFFGRTNLLELDAFMYRKYPDAKYVGSMEITTPTLIIRDLDVCKQIYVKDFDHFLERRVFPTGDELAEKFLFNMKGAVWKDTRAAMSPVFTTNKIRRMFPIMEKSTADFKKYVEMQKAKTGTDEIELRDIFGRYTMDIIAGTAFGIEARCLIDEDSHFMKMGRRLQTAGVIRTLKIVVAVFLPLVAKIFGIRPFGDAESMTFFKTVIRNAVKARRTRKGEFYDFVAAFVEQIDTRNAAKDDIKSNHVPTKNAEAELDKFEKDMEINTVSSKKFDDDEITANSLAFFFAGFDASETLLTLCAYHMAIDSKIQNKLLEEIERVCEEFDGKITYDGIAKMQYLDMLIHEVLRLYSVTTRTERTVSKEWQLPGTDIILPVGQRIVMPVYGFHNDEKYFKDPKKFDPERFSPENTQKRHPYAWMPFGHGPRGCIGIRFALVEAKAAIAHLVKNFEVSPCKDTWVPLQFDNVPGQLKPKRGLKVSIRERHG